MEQHSLKYINGSAQKTPEKKRPEKVIEGKAVVKPKSFGEKFKDAFFSEDTKKIKSYILKDEIIPAAQNLLLNVVSNSLEMALFGTTSSRKGRRDKDEPSYTKYYSKKNSGGSFTDNRKRPAYDKVVVESRKDAESLIDYMRDYLATYKSITVAELYDMIDVPSEFTDNSYGWTSLNSIEIERVSDGYWIKFPRPMELD